jgi:hypothetical protein
MVLMISDKMNVKEGRRVLVSSLGCFMLGRKNVVITASFLRLDMPIEFEGNPNNC